MKIFVHRRKNERTGENFISKKDLRRLNQALKFSELIKENLEIEYIMDKFIPK